MTKTNLTDIKCIEEMIMGKKVEINRNINREVAAVPPASSALMIKQALENQLDSKACFGVRAECISERELHNLAASHYDTRESVLQRSFRANAVREVKAPRFKNEALVLSYLAELCYYDKLLMMFKQICCLVQSEAIVQESTAMNISNRILKYCESMSEIVNVVINKRETLNPMYNDKIERW